MPRSKDIHLDLDPNSWAAEMVSKVTGHPPPTGVIKAFLERQAAREGKKNPAAVALGKLGGLKGGKARLKTMTAKERSEVAQKAAKARWAKQRKKEALLKKIDRLADEGASLERLEQELNFPPGTLSQVRAAPTEKVR